MKTFAERLKYAREKAGYARAKDFAEEHGLAYSTYQSHESGARKAKPDDVRDYAKKMGVRYLWLLEEDGPMLEKHVIRDAIPVDRRVPLISWVQAGAFSYTGDAKTLEDAEEWLQLPLVKTPSFALKVKGDSMDNIAPEGTVIVVDFENKVLQDRKLYIFECEGDLTFKRYRKIGAERWLYPDSSNKTHKPIRCDQPVRVVGNVFMLLTKI